MEMDDEDVNQISNSLAAIDLNLNRRYLVLYYKDILKLYQENRRQKLKEARRRALERIRHLIVLSHRLSSNRAENRSPLSVLCRTSHLSEDHCFSKDSSISFNIAMTDK